jgi:hypothetical protein
MTTAEGIFMCFVAKEVDLIAEKFTNVDRKIFAEKNIREKQVG